MKTGGHKIKFSKNAFDHWPAAQVDALAAALGLIPGARFEVKTIKPLKIYGSKTNPAGNRFET